MSVVTNQPPPSYADLILDELGDGCRIFENVPARALTTFAVGGSADIVVEPAGIEQLSALLHCLTERGLPWRTVGFGSNVIIPDAGIKEILIRLGPEFSDFSVAEESVTAGGGTSLMTLSRKVSEAGLSGLEFAAGIPASVGGAVRMNAGAHGHECGEVVSQVTVVSSAGEIKQITGDDLKFSYRSTKLENDCIVVAVQCLLMPGDPEEILSRRSACLEYRKQTQPLQLPSAGSVFRNVGPEREQAAGYLLEQVGLKGFRRGGVCYSDLHANWLVRCSNEARATDVEALINIGRDKVAAQFGVELQPEIILW